MHTLAVFVHSGTRGTVLVLYSIMPILILVLLMLLPVIYAKFLVPFIIAYECKHKYAYWVTVMRPLKN